MTSFYVVSNQSLTKHIMCFWIWVLKLCGKQSPRYGIIAFYWQYHIVEQTADKYAFIVMSVKVSESFR